MSTRRNGDRTRSPDKPAYRRWLNHRSDLTGPSGASARLAQRLHPTQEPEKVMSKSTKSKARGGAEHYWAVRAVEAFYELDAQGRLDEEVEMVFAWLRQQLARVRGDEPPPLELLMDLEQEADAADDPLQLKVARGEMEHAPEAADRLEVQGARSLALARRLRQTHREWRINGRRVRA